MDKSRGDEVGWEGTGVGETEDVGGTEAENA